MRRAILAVVLAVAMGFAASCRARRDDRTSRYGPETVYEGAASTLPLGTGGGPPASGAVPYSIAAPTSASASSTGAASCVVPPSIRPTFPPATNPNTIPPRPNPAQSLHG